MLSNNNSKLLPNSCPGVYELGCKCRGKYTGETKNVCLLDQWNIKEIASQENGKDPVQLNIPKIVMRRC